MDCSTVLLLPNVGRFKIMELRLFGRNYVFKKVMSEVMEKPKFSYYVFFFFFWTRDRPCRLGAGVTFFAKAYFLEEKKNIKNFYAWVTGNRIRDSFANRERARNRNDGRGPDESFARLWGRSWRRTCAHLNNTISPCDVDPLLLRKWN